jgi:hypothetical protein
VPFDAKIVFSTNLEPKTLGDEAFFRRIQSKILIPTITDEQFDEVLRRVTDEMGVHMTPDAPTHLRWMSRELGDGDLRPYLPGAVCKILLSVCAFDEIPLVLDPPMIERIANMYFTHADDTPEDQLGGLPAGVMSPIMIVQGAGGQPMFVQPQMVQGLTGEVPPGMVAAAQGQAGPQPSMFSAPPPEPTAAAPSGEPAAPVDRDWQSAAAKAVSSMQDEQVDLDELLDGDDEVVFDVDSGDDDEVADADEYSAAPQSAEPIAMGGSSAPDSNGYGEGYAEPAPPTQPQPQRPSGAY